MTTSYVNCAFIVQLYKPVMPSFIQKFGFTGFVEVQVYFPSNYSYNRKELQEFRRNRHWMVVSFIRDCFCNMHLNFSPLVMCYGDNLITICFLEVLEN